MNVPCVVCGRSDLPLHVNYVCPECFLPNERTNNMIPADSILLDGDRAWWVWKANGAFDGESGEDYIHVLDRPCDTCGGRGVTGHGRYKHDCPDCDGTGRHVFEIEVRASHPPICQRHDPCSCVDYDGLPHCKLGCGYDDVLSWPTTTYRVAVLRVLEITDDSELDPQGREYGGPMLTIDHEGGVRLGDDWDGWVLLSPFPPDAAPGKWAVELAVQERSVTSGS